MIKFREQLKKDVVSKDYDLVVSLDGYKNGNYRNILNSDPRIMESVRRSMDSLYLQLYVVSIENLLDI